MKIESIKPGKRDREKLVIRTECGSYISARIDDAYSLKVGDEISCEQAAELERAYNAQKVKQSAARSLAHHSMSKSDLSRKLRDKGFSDEESEKAADWFEEKGLVDDEAFARATADYYKRRGYGKMRIREELRRRGIEKELIDGTVETLGSSESELCALIEKKLRGKELDADNKRRLIAFLTRRGFRFDEIRAAMTDLRLDTEDMT